MATLNITGPKAPVSKFNRPLLQGLTVYQRQVTTASGKVMTKRDVMTFRVISEKQKGQGFGLKKQHQGLESLMK